MKRYDFTVVGTAATVSILHVNQMPECGKSTPVFGGSFTEYSNGGMGLNICAGLARLGEAVYPVLTYCRHADGGGNPHSRQKDRLAESYGRKHPA